MAYFGGLKQSFVGILANFSLKTLKGCSFEGGFTERNMVIGIWLWNILYIQCDRPGPRFTIIPSSTSKISCANKSLQT